MAHGFPKQVKGCSGAGMTDSACNLVRAFHAQSSIRSQAQRVQAQFAEAGRGPHSCSHCVALPDPGSAATSGPMLVSAAATNMPVAPAGITAIHPPLPAAPLAAGAVPETANQPQLAHMACVLECWLKGEEEMIQQLAVVHAEGQATPHVYSFYRSTVVPRNGTRNARWKGVWERTLSEAEGKRRRRQRRGIKARVKGTMNEPLQETSIATHGRQLLMLFGVEHL